MSTPDELTDELRVALRPTWIVPLAGGLVELLVVGIVVGLGVYYDSIQRLPGPLAGFGVALLTSRWVLLARLQWAAAQRYMAASVLSRDVVHQAERAVSRHGRAVVLQALAALEHPQPALVEAAPLRALP